jgi:hypothetical protein
MKKFLSLVLALAMTFSLVAVSASAKEYTDDSKIAYGEAVDVISGLGIVGGYADGSFGPTAALTRGAAAKIICNLLLGPTAADALGTSAAPFSDVPANHTFAGYISYCSEHGIISGYGDGTFRPAGTLTGYAFMKMLLGALGYDGSVEGFTGANWTVRVASLAIENKLYNGNSSFVGSKAVTREEACLYAFNTLTAKLVDYKGGTNVTTGDGTTVVVDAERYYVSNSITSGYKASGNDEYMQFCERYFDKLQLQTTYDDLGRPADKWVYANKAIGTYANDATIVYTADMDTESGDKTVKSDLKGYTYKSGLQSDGNVSEDTTIDSYDDVVGITGNGIAVEVYVTDNIVTDVVAIESTLAEVKKVTKDEVTFVGSDVNKVEADDDLYDFFAGLKKGDKAVVIVDGSKDAIEAYEPEYVTGKYTKNKGTGDTIEYTVGGTAYQKANGASVSMTLGTTYTLTLDKYGYILAVGDEKVADDVYGYVLDASANVDRGDYDYALKLLFADGSTKWVDVSKVGDDVVADGDVATTTLDGLKGKFVSYVETSKGYEVTSEASNTDATQTGSITKGDSDMLSYTASNATIFLVKNGSTYTVYNGIKNVPSMSIASAGDVVILKDGTVALMVVVDKSATTSNEDQVFIYDTTQVGEEKDGSTTVKYYNAIVNGEDTTIGVADGAGSVAVGLFVNNSYTKEYISTLGTKVDADEGESASIKVFTQAASDNLTDLKLKNGVLTVDMGSDETYVMADEYESWLVKSFGSTKEVDTLALDDESTVTSEGITLASGDYVIIVCDDDGYVTDLYLVDVTA